MSLVLRRLVPGLAVSPLAVAAALACAGGAALAQPQQEPAAAAQPEAQADAALPAVKATARAERSTEGTGAYTTRSANTATKLDLSLRETPQSISVVTRTQIEDFGLMSVNDLLSSVTGVNVERVETDRTYFSVRGFEVSNFQIDGIGLPFATGDQLGDLDTALYDRVEVLRGANGLASSTGNPSATVNFVRKRPIKDVQASAGLTLGSWNNRRVDADVSGALNESGSVRGRIVAAAQKKDSYLDRYSLKKHVFSAVVEADLSADTTLAVGHSQQHNRPTGVMWGALPLAYADGTSTNYARGASTAADWSYWNTDDLQTFAEVTHRLANDWQLKGNLTHREISSDAEMLYVYTNNSFLPGSNAGVLSWPSKYDHTERQWIADAYASGPFTLAGRRHELMVGAGWARSSNDLHSYDDDVDQPMTEQEMLAGTFPRPAFDGPLTGYADFTNRRTTLYAAARLNPADALKVIVGANVTRVSSSGTQYALDHNYRKTKASPYLGAIYDLDENHSLYASYAGIFNPQHQTDRTGRVLDPIEGSNAELGAKGEWLNKRLNGSVAIFRVKQKNSPVFDIFDAGQSRYKGVNATSTGYELDLAGRLTAGWEMSGGFTQMRLEDDAGNDVRLHVPRKTFRLTTSYRVPALPALKVGASVKWQDDISTETRSARQDAYALLDLMARYDFTKNLFATLNVYNVTDETHLNSLQWSQSYWGAPRNASVSLNWQY